MLKKPKTIKLIIKDPRNPKGKFRFDCTEVTIEREFYPDVTPPYYTNTPTGFGTITARFIKRGKK